MSDITCPKCWEAWDLDTIHEEVSARNEDGIDASFNEVVRSFQGKGCVTFVALGVDPDECVRSDATAARALAAATMYDLLGDDIDGVIEMLEDFDYMGQF